MKSLIQKIGRAVFFHSPKSFRRLVTAVLESAWHYRSMKILSLEERSVVNKINGGIEVSETHDSANRRIRVLFYHIDGLSYGGTEKFLQILARHINPNAFEVFYAHGDANTDRAEYLEGRGIRFRPFKYDCVEKKHPYIVHDMKPSLAKIIEDEQIDVIVSATPGHTIFPLNIIRKTPIVNINIFGSFAVQPNIKSIINLSQEIFNRSTLVSKNEINHIMYIPSERPVPKNESSQALRQRFGIASTDFVFGRIGRPSDDIFDPIALNGFKEFHIAKPDQARHCHFLIMAPSPIMISKVRDEQIPNVHFIDPSPREEDVFAFHHAIDCLAHARLDGETSGLNITESMLCGNPIITHRSHIWNAHLEYLLPAFSRVADKDDHRAYAAFMSEFHSAFCTKPDTWQDMRQASQTQAEKLFLIESNIGRFEGYVLAALKS